MAVLTPYQHIVINDEGVPIISGTNAKVIELASSHLSHGWSAEELQYQHPYLSMGKIHSALAYYWDHKEELDRDMEKRFEYVESLRKASEPIPLFQRLASK
jgi:uncharacterized protein (DUF433 family)